MWHCSHALAVTRSVVMPLVAAVRRTGRATSRKLSHLVSCECECVYICTVSTLYSVHSCAFCRQLRIVSTAACVPVQSRIRPAAGSRCPPPTTCPPHNMIPQHNSPGPAGSVRPLPPPRPVAPPRSRPPRGRGAGRSAARGLRAAGRGCRWSSRHLRGWGTESGVDGVERSERSGVEWRDEMT